MTGPHLPGVLLHSTAGRDITVLCTVRTAHQDGFGEVAPVHSSAQERLDDLFVQVSPQGCEPIELHL